MQERQFIWAFLYQATRGLQIGALPQGALATNGQTQSAMRSAFARNAVKRNKLQ
jgi:hypothetical protein